jgi:hypothetical protein
MSVVSNLPSDLNRERLLDTAQTAEFLGMSIPHFRLWGAEGADADQDRRTQVRLAPRRTYRFRDRKSGGRKLRRAPEMRSPAPRANAGNRADSKLLNPNSDSTKPAPPPNLVTTFVATRARLAKLVGAWP